MADNTASRRWWESAAVYQIYPWSFKDSDGDGRGDLRGIIEKLDYLNGSPASLGVDAIWLSPIFRSPMIDLGYDVADYCDIDPMFGTLKDFDDLLREAHQRNIKVLLDFVPNHTSDKHPWFLESRSSRTNPKRDWYLWRDPRPDGSPPNNWLSRFGGSAWTLDETAGQYYMHSFFSQQPDLNWKNPEVQQAMMGVLRFWFDRGVDGFRVDAIVHLSKDDQCGDDSVNPDYVAGEREPYFSLLHSKSANFGGRIWPLELMCRVADQYADRILVTEAYDDVERLRSYSEFSPSGILIPFNFHFIHIESREKIPWEAAVYKKFVDDYEASLRSVDTPNYVLGNHDNSRIATRVGIEKARLLAVLQMTLRGAAFIYYGEELGMEDVPISEEVQQDPLPRFVPGFSIGRDPERTPMQWNGEPNAGFSAGKPWLPTNPDYTARNIDVELADPSSMFNLYRTLLRLRRTSSAVREGAYRSLESGVSDVFVFTRQHQQEIAAVYLNFSNEERRVSLQAQSKRFLCGTHGQHGTLGESASELILRPYEGCVLLLASIPQVLTVPSAGRESSSEGNLAAA